MTAWGTGVCRFATAVLTDWHLEVAIRIAKGYRVPAANRGGQDHDHVPVMSTSQADH
jgi:hypothetical protein